MRKKLLSLRDHKAAKQSRRIRDCHAPYQSLAMTGGDAVGFTLIELLVVFALFFIATTAGMVSFRQYSSSQTLDTAAKDLITFLNSARTNAVTQSIPNPPCTTSQLVKYSIKINLTPPGYQMWIYCNGTSYLLRNKTLPNGLSFDTAPEITFNAATGNSPGGTIVLRSSPTTSKNIQVDTSGNITGN